MDVAGRVVRCGEGAVQRPDVPMQFGGCGTEPASPRASRKTRTAVAMYATTANAMKKPSHQLAEPGAPPVSSYVRRNRQVRARPISKTASPSPAGAIVCQLTRLDGYPRAPNSRRRRGYSGKARA